jgi:hypothetical protein
LFDLFRVDIRTKTYCGGKIFQPLWPMVRLHDTPTRMAPGRVRIRVLLQYGPICIALIRFYIRIPIVENVPIMTSASIEALMICQWKVWQ